MLKYLYFQSPKMGFKLLYFCLSDFMYAISLSELSFSHSYNEDNNTCVIYFTVVMKLKDNACNGTLKTRKFF